MPCMLRSAFAGAARAHITSRPPLDRQSVCSHGSAAFVGPVAFVGLEDQLRTFTLCGDAPKLHSNVPFGFPGADLANRALLYAMFGGCCWRALVPLEVHLQFRAGSKTSVWASTHRKRLVAGKAPICELNGCCRRARALDARPPKVPLKLRAKSKPNVNASTHRIRLVTGNAHIDAATLYSANARTPACGKQ